DIDHRTPLRKARAALVIFFQPFGEPVEPDGDEFARTVRQGLRSFVDLDPGNGAGLLDQFDQRRAVFGVLPDGLVVEDDAGDISAHRLLRAEQHLAIIAAIVLGRFHLDGVEALLDGAGRFVGGKDALARSYHGDGDFVEIGDVHRETPRARAWYWRPK